MPDLGYTSRQLFWMSYGRTNCRKFSDETVLEILNSQHALNMYRIIGPLQSNINFAKDFGCKIGSGMNPTKKCIIW